MAGDREANAVSEVSITPLGAGNEVGRSCIVLSYKKKNIMLDCGIHPAYQGYTALPYFDEIDPADIDIVLITHFHLDHVASLPYFLEKTNFKGKVFMTHPTKAIYKWLLLDYIKVSNVSSENELFNEKDLVKSYEKIQAIDYHQEIDCDGVKFTCFNAGHVLGAAMFVIEIADVKILYTGDYSVEDDRHLLPAEIPHGRSPDIMICESTYGVQSHEPRPERERRFTSLVHEIVSRGGKCLLPVFALGKSQELLLILDEYWHKHSDLHQVPIYYSSSLAKKCVAIYQTYHNMMNPGIRNNLKSRETGAIDNMNPFMFKYISNIKDVRGIDPHGPCVMIASPGMLQSGLSRQIFEAWCSDRKNGVIIPGYSVEGTLAKHILSEPSEIVSSSGSKLPLNMSVEYISFSAHVDFTQNSRFIDTLKPRHLVLVHGEFNEMNRLRLALQHRYDETKEKTLIYMPKNCEAISIPFQDKKIVRTVGRLSNTSHENNSIVSGVLVGKDFEYHVMESSDLERYTNLSVSSVKQRQWITTTCHSSLIEHHIIQLFGKGFVKSSSKEGLLRLSVMDSITVEQKGMGELLLIEWYSSPMADLMVDSVISVIISSASCPASVKLSHADHEDHDLFLLYLKQYFGDVSCVDKKRCIYRICVDGLEFVVDNKSLEIEGPEGEHKAHVKDIVLLYSLASSEWTQTR